MPAPFHADAMDVLYDADTACMGKFETIVSSSALRTVALPYAIGARPERRLFHFHVNPFSNSFQELDPRYESFYEFQAGRDYIMGEVTRSLKQVELDVRTIDQLAADPDRPIPAPDFLLADAEGSDYDVLAGARESLRARGLAVSVEAQFQPIWRNQRLLGDICRLLAQLGFDLASVNPHPGQSPHRTPVGLRGRMFHTSCDAVFLRRIDSLADATPDVNVRWIRTRKLAFSAFLLGHVAYGIKALASARAIPASPEIRNAARPVSYMRFLDEVEEAISRAPAQFPPLFREAASAQGRPGEPNTGQGTAARIKAGIKAAFAHFPRVLSTIQAMRRQRHRLTKATRERVRSLRWRAFPRYTEFERLLLSYGLADVADLVRTTRLTEEPFAENREASA